jgi:hypothetical protein
MSKLLIFSLLLFVAPSLSAETILSGKVVKIVDGDTFDLLINGKTTCRIRLKDIDSPEKGQDYYTVCKQALADYIFNQQVSVSFEKRDRNQRIIGTVYNGQVNVNLIMVQEGYAWHYKKYSSDILFSKAEEQAKNVKRGLWQQPKPMAPWDFRKDRRRK